MVGTQRNKVCGVDVHKRFIQAIIMSRNGEKNMGRYGTSVESLISFKKWVLDNGCEAVAFESTGIYWYPLYDLLEGSLEVILANPYNVKHVPGRKTDVKDSEWIAELCLNGLIEKSRVLHRTDRETRSLTRHREALTNQRTQLKNRIHKALESCSIKLGSVLSDVFGQTGMHVLNGILEGRDIEDILKGIRLKQMQGKKELIREAIRNSLDVASVHIIKDCLRLIDAINEEIEDLDMEINRRFRDRKLELEIAMSMPGIGFVSACTLLAEIGDCKDFETPDKLASWCGLAPSVYQSADKQITGSITKRGSKHVRRILVEIAHAVTKVKDTRLKLFFLHIKHKKGVKVAIVALARKILCILHHLLTNKEPYIENKKREKKWTPGHKPLDKTSIDEMIDILAKAGYLVVPGRWYKGHNGT
jgi:transposase